MTKIKVRISRDALYRILGGQPVHAGLHVNKILRENGIPIIGTLWIESVENGKLTQYREGADFVYEWEGHPKQMPLYNDPDEF